jgi:hypothetical protein
LDKTRAQLSGTSSRVRQIDPSNLVGPLRRPFERFASKAELAESASDAAARAVRVLPTMLGKDGPRTYLLLFDNNAEIRATGGMPGSFALVRTDRGAISMVSQGVPDQIGKFAAPVLPQEQSERAIYDTQIAEYMQDTNFTPDFPRTAQLVREMWQRHTGQMLDGVWSIDTVSLAPLLRATGPVQAPGVKLTAANAVDELLNRTYFRLPTSTLQNAFFRRAARLLFNKVVSGTASPVALASALAESASQGRLYVHDFNPTVQRQLATTLVAGDLHEPPRTPVVGIYLNDATGSKMSYYLRATARIRSTSCRGGRQSLNGAATFTYSAKSPPISRLNDFVTGDGSFGTPKGQQLVLVRIYGPDGGSISAVQVAGEPTPVQPVVVRGRTVVTLAVQLRRGDAIPVRWDMKSGLGQDRDPLMSMTPGLENRPAVRSTRTSCNGS